MKVLWNQILNRIPSEYEIRSLEQEFSNCKFSGCIGSLDIMHLHCKNCLRDLKDQYNSPKSRKLATVQVEAVSEYNLYCWHVHTRRPGTSDDLTVLESSPVVISVIYGARPTNLINGNYINGK